MVEVTTARYIIFSIVGAAFIIFLIFYIIAKSKGRVKIRISNYNYSPGDTINGTVMLSLKKPISSKFLNIALKGVQRTTRPSRDSKGRSSTQTDYMDVFSFKQSLEDKKDYPIGEKEYSFKIKIPSNIIQKSINHPLAGTLVSSMQMLSGTSSSIQWYLIAELETSGFNLSDKVQINIS